MNIKKDIESLIESVSSIEKRHFLEILGVIDGIKNVMRIHINLYKEYEILLIFAKKHNLKIGLIKDLIEYRSKKENIVIKIEEKRRASQ